MNPSLPPQGTFPYNPPMRWGWMALPLLLAACGTSEPRPADVETTAHEWRIPSERTQEKVSPPLVYEELQDYVRRYEGQGWKLRSYEAAGAEFPSRYVAVLYRPR